MAILGMIYNVIILGPTGFLGSAVFFLFYPALVSKPPCYTLAASPERTCNGLGLALFGAERFCGVFRRSRLTVIYSDPCLWPR